MEKDKCPRCGSENTKVITDGGMLGLEEPEDRIVCVKCNKFIRVK